MKKNNINTILIIIGFIFLLPGFLMEKKSTIDFQMYSAYFVVGKAQIFRTLGILVILNGLIYALFDRLGFYFNQRIKHFGIILFFLSTMIIANGFIFFSESNGLNDSLLFSLSSGNSSIGFLIVIAGFVTLMMSLFVPLFIWLKVSVRKIFNKNILFGMGTSLLFLACKNDKQPSLQNEKLSSRTERVAETPPCEMPENQRIAQVLRTYFGKEVEGLVKENRQFLYDAYDINWDGKPEYFVGLFSPYFCVSGGCTVLVLNNDLSVHSKFVLVNYPVYVSQKYATEGWADLFLYADKAFHLVKSKGGKYPENPTTEPETDVSNYPARVPLLLDASVRKCGF